METEKKINLIIADDHLLFRKGLLALLADYSLFKQIREAQDGKQLLELVARYKPDVILLDLNMPELSGAATMPILFREHPEVKVIILTMHGETSVVANLIAQGASGYLLKDTDIDELVKAIKTVANGKTYVNSLVAEVLMQNARPKNISEPDMLLKIALSDQETKLLNFVVMQLTNAQIAEKMNLGVRTVESYRLRIMKKTGVKNTAGLVAFALEHHLVKPHTLAAPAC